MIFRVRKIHVFSFLLFLVSVSFFFAVKADRVARPVSSDVGLELPVVMYHHVTKKQSRAGKYVITAAELERDLEYIKKKGYSTVTVSDLIDYVDGKKELPKKIVMITFDDGFESVRELAEPLLKKNGMCAVLSVVGSITETYSQNHDRNVNYAYLNWDDLRELEESREFEIQNHTYDMHNISAGGRKGLSRKSGESPVDYEAALSADLLKMQKLLRELSGVNATAVAYPYGSYSRETLDIVKKLGFKASFVCEERVNKILRGDEQSLFNLGRFNRPSGKATEDFFERLLK